MTDYYDQHFQSRIGSDESVLSVMRDAANAYLDGKAASRGKHKVTRSERHAAFWPSDFLTTLPAQAWQSQAMTLALAQYLRQERVANMAMLANVAAVAPDALVRAVRCSGLVLKQHSPRRTELDQLAASSPVIENHELNRVVYIKAMRTQLQLTEVYGVGPTVTTGAGDSVPLFQALLSLKLMNVFFQRDFLESYVKHLRTAGDWAAALSVVSMQGLKQGVQLRFPLTWSGRADKISSMVGWTVTAEHSQGDRRQTEAIVDFWTSDWAKLANQMRNAEPGLWPELFERPILIMGQTLVQLPWVVGLQNNSTAAINNLRRLGQRRGEARAETQRIETQLGALLRTCGFQVVFNRNLRGLPKKSTQILVVKGSS